MGIFGPRFCLSYLPLAKQAAFRCRISLVAQSALFVEVTRTFTTSLLLRRESAAQERSTTELQRLSKRCHWWGSNPRPK